MTGRVFLLGGTDLTLAVAERLFADGIEIAGLAYVGERFDISYAQRGVANSRVADVAGWCVAHGVPSHAYEGVDRLESVVRASAADLGLAVGWYHMISRRVRALFPRGCLGLHASLLPRLRGGAPLNWAMLSRERETGVTLFELADGIDDGPVYGYRRFPIVEGATIGDLVAVAEEATVGLVGDFIPRILGGTLRPEPQTGTPTYALQRGPEDGRIDWSRPAEAIELLVRAVGRPYPGARSTFDGREFVIWSVALLPAAPTVLGAPGQIVVLPNEDAPCVVTGSEVLVLREVTDEAGSSVMGELMKSANRRFAQQ